MPDFHLCAVWPKVVRKPECHPAYLFHACFFAYIMVGTVKNYIRFAGIIGIVPNRQHRYDNLVGIGQ